MRLAPRFLLPPSVSRVSRVSAVSLSAIATLASMVLLPTTAEAKCMQPSAALAPSDGSVPQKPVFWLFVPEWQASKSTPLFGATSKVGGKTTKLPVIVFPESKAAGMQVFRVEVPAAKPGPLELDLADPSGAPTTWSFTVDPGWKAPTTSATTVTFVHEVSSWKCSHNRTTNLVFPATAFAYRVVTAATADELKKGKGRSFVLPRSSGLLWGSLSSWITTNAPEAAIPLGHVNCYGMTFDFTASSTFADVFALQADGSEQKVNAAPLSIPAP